MPRAKASFVPSEVTDEAILVPPSETKYWILLSDDQVELLARGIVGRETAQRAFHMLSWKRDQQRWMVEELNKGEVMAPVKPMTTEDLPGTSTPTPMPTKPVPPPPTPPSTPPPTQKPSA